MPYLTSPNEIRSLITQLTSYPILWLDTEVADWDTPNPRLSLIQVLANPTDLTGECAYVIDVLDKPELVSDFVRQIMVNSQIEKVFHNASFDVRYLGGKDEAVNITCTYKMVKKLTKNKQQNPLQVSNKKLKTLAIELCHFDDVDKEEQASDWGKRPLREKQLQYAKMDVVYLAHVHKTLLELPEKDNQPKEEKLSESLTVKVQDTSLSVTHVRLAFECPRLFYLVQRFGGKTLFLPPNRLKGIGSIFHKLAEDFIEIAKKEPQFTELFQPPIEQLKVDKLASQMQQLFYNKVFFPYLQFSIKENPTQATALHQIWQGLTKLIPQWAALLVKNRQYCQANTLINKTFIANELKLEHTFTLPDNSQQQLSGKLDSLVFNFEDNRLCVVEFKTYQPIEVSAQLAQVALYSYLLWQKEKVPVDSRVYCVLPEFKEYHYTWEQLENTVHQLTTYKLQQMRQWLSWEAPQPNPPPPTTQSHLCDICPQKEKCQTFFDEENLTPQPPSLQGKGEKDSAVISPPLIREAGGIEPEDSAVISPPLIREAGGIEPAINPNIIGNQLVETLASFNIGVEYLGATIGVAFVRVKLKPNSGVKINSILKLSADLQVQLGLENPPLIAPQAGYVSVDLPRIDRQIASFQDYLKNEMKSINDPVKIAIGVDLNGKLIEADLSDPNTCHFLVGGTTGSGKSEFLRSLLLSLLYRHAPSQLKIALVDPKRVTFPEFEEIPWLLSPIAKDAENAIALMDNLVAEMERRYQKFEQSGSPHLEDYNKYLIKQEKLPLPRLVCIFDEYADFMTEKDTRNSLEQSIKRLGAMARAAGIHLIISTQRPEAKVVTPIIRSNLPGRVALRTASEADSGIILGGSKTEAAYLLGKGDLLYQVGSQFQRLQSLFAQTIKLN